MLLAWAFLLQHRSTRVTECERWAQADSPQRLHMSSCDGCFHQEETIIAPCHFTPVITLLQTCVSFRCVTAQSSDCSALAFYRLGPWYKKKNLGLSKCSIWFDSWRRGWWVLRRKTAEAGRSPINSGLLSWRFLPLLLSCWASAGL